MHDPLSYRDRYRGVSSAAALFRKHQADSSNDRDAASEQARAERFTEHEGRAERRDDRHAQLNDRRLRRGEAAQGAIPDGVAERRGDAAGSEGEQSPARSDVPPLRIRETEHERAPDAHQDGASVLPGALGGNAGFTPPSSAALTRRS